jgi:hypothetical protein
MSVILVERIYEALIIEVKFKRSQRTVLRKRMQGNSGYFYETKEKRK